MVNKLKKLIKKYYLLVDVNCINKIANMDQDLEIVLINRLKLDKNNKFSDNVLWKTGNELEQKRCREFLKIVKEKITNDEFLQTNILNSLINDFKVKFSKIEHDSKFVIKTEKYYRDLIENKEIWLEFQTEITCDNLEYGIAATWVAFATKYSEMNYRVGYPIIQSKSEMAAKKHYLEKLFNEYEDKISQLDDITKYNPHTIDFMWSGFNNRFFHVRFDDEYYWKQVKCICQSEAYKSISISNILDCEEGEEDNLELNEICPCEDTTCSDAIMDFHDSSCPDFLRYDSEVIPNTKPVILISWNDDMTYSEDQKTQKIYKHGQFDSEVIYMTNKEYEQYKLDHPEENKTDDEIIKKYTDRQKKISLNPANDRYFMREYRSKMYGINETIHRLSLDNIPLLEKNIKRLDKELHRQNTFKECLKAIKK